MSLISRRFVAATFAGALALAACGSDDGGGGGGVQGELADEFLSFIGQEGNEGLSVDEGCVRSVLGEMSDEDARLLLEAGPDGDDPEGLSAEADAIGERVFVECISFDS